MTALDATIKKLNEAQAVAAKALLRLVTNSSSVLAKGEFNDGGAQSFPTNHAPLTLAVKAGEMLLLTVHPRANHGADTTLIEFNVEDVVGDGERWNLAADVVDDFLAGNPHADQHGHAATWCFLDAATDGACWPTPCATIRAGDCTSGAMATLCLLSSIRPMSHQGLDDAAAPLVFVHPPTARSPSRGSVRDRHGASGTGRGRACGRQRRRGVGCRTAAPGVGMRMTDLAPAPSLHEPMQRRAELMARE